jgi:hypothetical protein
MYKPKNARDGQPLDAGKRNRRFLPEPLEAAWTY